MYSFPVQVFCDLIDVGEQAQIETPKWDELARLGYILFYCFKNKANDPHKSQKRNVTRLICDVNKLSAPGGHGCQNHVQYKPQ